VKSYDAKSLIFTVYSVIRALQVSRRQPWDDNNDYDTKVRNPITAVTITGKMDEPPEFGAFWS